MRGMNMARRGLLFVGALLLVGGIALSSANTSVADAGEGGKSLGDFAEQALEQLPWDKHIIRANLGSRNPVAVAGVYLMQQQLLVVSNAGRVYCLDRQNLEPRWVNTLRYPLAQPPAEGPAHYAFLMKDNQGAHWITVISKRSGSEAGRFPVRLPFTASSGISVNGSLVFVGSLGHVRNNKTVDSVNLISGRSGWGYRTTGMTWGTPTLDPSGTTLIVTADDGVVTALPGSASAPARAHWARDLGGGVRGAAAVTPEAAIVGNDDGVLYSMDLHSGQVQWLKGLDERIRTTPVVFGGFKVVQESTGVEGASLVDVKRYEGLVFASNVNGLHCFDVRTGADRFSDSRGGRPVCRNGKHLVTVDGKRKLCIRDMSKGFEVAAEVNLGMADLIPTNSQNGELFAATADGTILVAVPK
ncbi:MAG: PQQ-binding-like beta-propeller repeat protein [Planctomycetota bacterium]|nr:PQQ-binding-like beta-propeller repeat protein [Planctomycetota bacterium]